MAEYGELDNISLKNISPINKENKKNSLTNLNFSLFDSSNTKRIKINLKTKLIFFRQLSVILQSGVPLSQGLDLLSENITNKKFAKCIDNISKDLGSGKDLSNSFQNYPRIFDPIVVGLIEAGEAGGILSEVLERIALLLEEQSKLKGQITGALIYPVILLALALTVSLGLLIFIVPTFEELFDGLGAKLPALTQFMLDLSRIVTSTNFFIITPIVVFLVLYFFKQYYSTNSGRLLVDTLLLRLPLFGDLILRSELASLSDTFSTLLNSGLPITEALEKCIASSSNQLVKNSIIRSISMVKEGQLLSYSFSNSKFIPRLFISMMKIGEETGELSFMIEKIANFYKREVDEAVSVLTKAMEPAVIFVVSAIVGTIVVALYLPMFSLLEKI